MHTYRYKPSNAQNKDKLPILEMTVNLRRYDHQKSEEARGRSALIPTASFRPCQRHTHVEREDNCIVLTINDDLWLCHTDQKNGRLNRTLRSEDGGKKHQPF